jgi:hypothetical protein
VRGWLRIARAAPPLSAVAGCAQVDDIDSLCPIMDCKAVGNLGEAGGSPSLVSICGKSARSTLRVLSHGLAVSEMAVSELPGNPNAVWTVKKRRGDEHDAYIVVSFVNATLVLSIGETVEEVTDSGLKADTPTLHTALLGEDAIVQARTRTHPRPTSAHLASLAPARPPSPAPLPAPCTPCGDDLASY